MRKALRLMIEGTAARYGLMVSYIVPSLRPTVNSAVRRPRGLIHLPEAVQLIHCLEATSAFGGDVAEVGVCGGETAALLAAHMGERSLYLFDTFGGLPAPGKQDGQVFREGQFASPLETARRCVNHSRAHFFQGLFPESARGLENHSFSVVHLDVDLYEATLAGFRWFFPRMVPGGMIVSHDYGWGPGVNQAVEEFLREEPGAMALQLGCTHVMIYRKAS
jgi:hypothetical protein